MEREPGPRLVEAAAIDAGGDLRAQLAAIEELEERQRMLTAAGAGLASSVAAARSVGVSWHRIGLVTHLTPEGARRRWGR